MLEREETDSPKVAIVLGLEARNATVIKSLRPDRDRRFDTNWCRPNRRSPKPGHRTRQAPKYTRKSAPTLAVGTAGAIFLVRNNGDELNRHQVDPESSYPYVIAIRDQSKPDGGEKAAVEIADAKRRNGQGYKGEFYRPAEQNENNERNLWFCAVLAVGYISAQTAKPSKDRVEVQVI